MVLAAQASRYDPRMLWVVVELLARGYERFNPLALRRAAELARWPATLAVALEFARQAAPCAELDDYARFVTARILPACGERFFPATWAPGTAMARRSEDESLAEYKRWGYLAREIPISKELASPACGTMERSERRNLLRRLAERRGSVNLAEYVEALHGTVSRRQAQRDLRDAPFLVKRGNTRGASYALK